MKNNKASLAVFAMVLALTIPGTRACAQANPCKADMEKFCAGVSGKARKDCVKSHANEVSAPCKAKIAERQQASEGDRPCLVYIQQYCKDVQGKKALAACMKTHAKDVSAACNAKMAERKAQAKSVQPCAVYIQQYCKDAQGAAARKDCMKQHENEVSAACKAFMEKAKAASKGAKKE
jgi:hypothetical protein